MEYPIDLSKLKFFFKGKQINISNIDSIMIKKFFENENNPIIEVEDVNKLIGKPISIIFETNHGEKSTLIKNCKWTMEKLLGFYLYEMKPEIFFRKNKIKFFYNNIQIKPGNVFTLEDILKMNQIQ